MNNYRFKMNNGPVNPMNNQPNLNNIPFQQNSTNQTIYEQPMTNLNKKNKSNKKIFIFSGILVVGLIFGAFTLKTINSSKNNQNNLTYQQQNTVTQLPSTTNIDQTKTVLNNDFNGSPFQVKWPTDIKPTRMEIMYNPVTGEPTLMLVGEKTGVGTIIRSYNSKGVLNGYWVIVPDNPSNLQPTNNQTTQQNVQLPQNTQTQQQNTQTQQQNTQR